jgi:protocatechuate 3,4-dioxygenase beta subunit
VGEVDSRDARATRTDALGRFELTDLRIDLRHTLLVRAEDFACAVFDFPAAEWETTELELGDLPLESPTLVEGRVTDLEGRPMAELWVTADIEPRERDRLSPLDGGEGYLERLGSSDPMARTDARGRFRFADLPSGRWSLWAGAKGWARGGELAFSLSPGERRTDLLVAFEPLSFIAGTVLDDEGRPLSGVVVNVARAGEGRLTYDLSREDGSFSLHGLEAGSYRLTTEPFGEYAFADGRWDDVPAGTHDIELRLERAVNQRVRVVDRVGAALPGAYVGLADEAGDVSNLLTCDRDGRVLLRVPARSSFALGAYANRHFDPRSDFLDSFFRDERGELVPGTAVTVQDLVAGPEELVLKVPGLP